MLLEGHFFALTCQHIPLRSSCIFPSLMSEVSKKWSFRFDSVTLFRSSRRSTGSRIREWPNLDQKA